MCGQLFSTYDIPHDSSWKNFLCLRWTHCCLGPMSANQNLDNWCVPVNVLLDQKHSGLPCGSVGKETACNVGDLGLVPGLGRFPGEGKGHSLQYSGLENSMGYIVHGVTKSQTRLSNFHFTSETQYIQLMNSQMPGQLGAFFLQTKLTMWQ